MNNQNIDNEEERWRCENCGNWTWDYYADDDGLNFCKECWEGLK